MSPHGKAHLRLYSFACNLDLFGIERQASPADAGRPSGLSRAPVPVNMDEAPRAAVIGENEGRGMPDMAARVSPEADTSASSQGTLAPQQVIAKTVSEASANMQERSAEPSGGVQNRARSSQPSLIPKGQRGPHSAVNGSLQSHRVDSAAATPEKQG